MILCNHQIHAALDAKRLIITPDPQPRFPTIGSKDDYCPYNTHAVDLSLGSEITVPKSGVFAYDLMQTGALAPFIEQNSSRHKIDPTYILEPNKFVLGQTFEYVSFPLNHDFNQKSKTCLGARIEGKSSRAHIGLLVHFTAPTVHPGFKGNLTLEMINLGLTPIVLRQRMPIAQLIIEEVCGLPFDNESQFQGQETPAGSRKT